ncbi:MAG: acyl carrier protein [Thermoleophilia bacterium]
MTEDDATAVILDALAEVAPEADPARLDADAPIQDQVDLDSMDFLALMEAVRTRTGIEVPESDYRRLATIADGARYLAARTA